MNRSSFNKAAVAGVAVTLGVMCAVGQPAIALAQASDPADSTTASAPAATTTDGTQYITDTPKGKAAIRQASDAQRGRQYATAFKDADYTINWNEAIAVEVPVPVDENGKQTVENRIAALVAAHPKDAPASQISHLLGMVFDDDGWPNDKNASPLLLVDMNTKPRSGIGNVEVRMAGGDLSVVMIDDRVYDFAPTDYRSLDAILLKPPAASATQQPSTAQQDSAATRNTGDSAGAPDPGEPVPFPTKPFIDMGKGAFKAAKGAGKALTGGLGCFTAGTGCGTFVGGLVDWDKGLKNFFDAAGDFNDAIPGGWEDPIIPIDLLPDWFPQFPDFMQYVDKVYDFFKRLGAIKVVPPVMRD